MIVIGGDLWDFPSLNSHEEPGSAAKENARYKKDLEAGNKAFARFCKPIDKAIADESRRKNGWNPEKHFILGNHEDRADRAASNEPKWMGTVGSHNCDMRDFKRHGFLERVWLDGICYSHYFQSSHSNRALGGSVDNRLNKIGASFVQGHEQGFRYGNRIMASGKTVHGLVAGSCYLHEEDYRGAQGQKHWRGIVVLNEVSDGDYCIMNLTLDYLCRRNEGTSLVKYMRQKYKGQSWEHLSR